MLLNDYINKNFPNLQLTPPLFYQWPIAIRFELGCPYEIDECHYMDQVYKRSLSLFKRLHHEKDEVILVANLLTGATRSKIKIFNRNIKYKEVLYKLQQRTILYEENDDFNIPIHQYSLRCKVSDIKFINLLKAICNQDMNIKPKIQHDVFFINTTKNTVFHLYDDRGCDVIANDKETILPLYQEYNDWILDYDRVEINKVFK